MSNPEAIPAPSWMTTAERAEYDRDMAILAADPRTANGANRPAWLVKRVLTEAKAK